MVAIVLVVVTLALSIAISRVGTLALRLTGMSDDAAHFQARSAFYGVGFTTAEAESVVSHPVRRRIILVLMIAGNIGIATSVASILASVISTSSSGQWTQNLLLLVGGLVLLIVAANSRWVDRGLSRLVTGALRRWTTLPVHDYVTLLHLSTGYSVFEVPVAGNQTLANKTLAELNLSAHGILVLGIHRGEKEFIGAPTGRTRIRGADILVVYGPAKYLNALHPESSESLRRRSEHSINGYLRESSVTLPPPPQTPDTLESL